MTGSVLDNVFQERMEARRLKGRVGLRADGFFRRPWRRQAARDNVEGVELIYNHQA